jgi:hypothetical protein
VNVGEAFGQKERLRKTSENRKDNHLSFVFVCIPDDEAPELLYPFVDQDENATLRGGL